MAASRDGQLVEIEHQFLLDGGADIIHLTENRYIYVTEHIINVGTDVNRCDFPKWDALQLAVIDGCPETVRTLLDNGADVNAMNNYGDTPLHLAVKNKLKGIAEPVIDAGAGVNYRNNEWNALNWVSENEGLEIIWCLLNKGADIHAKNNQHETPFLLAVKNKHKGIAEHLINAGVDVNCCDIYGENALHWAIENRWPEIVQSLLEKGANIEAKNRKGMTPLQISCVCYKIEIIEHLLNAGADVNVKSNEGIPLITYIIIQSDIKLARLLVKNGTYLDNVNYNTIKRHPLLKEDLLQDIEFCSQAIINEFNHKVLPELYKLSVVSQILPRIENMKIGNVESSTKQSPSQVTQEVLQSVKREIQLKGHCNVLKVRPNALKMLCVQSFLSYSDNIKKQICYSNRMKRSAEFDDNQHSSKVVRFN